MRIAIFCLFIMLPVVLEAQRLQGENLQCEYRHDPSGVESQHPSLSWELNSSGQNILQVAYRILVSDDSLQLQQGKGNAWDSNKILSDNSIQITYSGKSIQSSKKYFWRVMLWDNKGNHSGWSKTASWQMGLPTSSAWEGAKWVGYERLNDTAKIISLVHVNGKKEWGKRRDVLPLLRKSFTLTKTVNRATAYICGLGQFEMHINGKKVGDHFLDPGWTKYDQQALYVTFDITGYLQAGKNAVGVMLGNGFYYLPGERYRKMTGAYGYPEMIALVKIEYSDGTIENMISDK